MVLADSHEIPRVPCYSGTRTLQQCSRFVYGTLTHSGPVSHQVRLHKHHHRPVMLNRTMHTPQHPHSNTSTLDTDKGLGSSGFARHYYRNHCYFLFLRVLRCFTSPRSPHAPYTFRHGSPPLTVAGFPHSDILGSTPVYRLPEAYRRFPRPSSAPDAKASTMRSHTLTTPKGPASCAREMFQTHSYLMTRKITLHKQHKQLCC